MLEPKALKISEVISRAKGGKQRIKECAAWLKAQHASVVSDEDVASDNAYLKAVSSLLGRYEKVRKANNKEVARRNVGKEPSGLTTEEFMQQDVVFPEKRAEAPSRPNPSATKESNFDEVLEHAKNMEGAAKEVAKELHVKAEEVERMQGELGQKEAEVDRLKAAGVHAMEDFSTMEKKLDSATEELHCRDRELELTSAQWKDKLELARADRKRTKERERYLRRQMSKVEIEQVKAEEEIQNVNHQLEEELMLKEQEITRLTQRVAELESKEKEDSEVISTLSDTDKRKFTPEFHMLVYDLLDLRVPAEKVGDVTATVLKFAGLKAEKLPCRSTINNFNHERVPMAHLQISESLTSNEKTLTLASDETSKFGEKYMGYYLVDETGRSYCLGLRNVATKSAADSLGTLKEIISNIDCVIEGSNSVGATLLANIRSTMSDRAATEKKFHELFDLYRKEVLPIAIANFHTLSEEERAPLERLNHFFCGLHTLVNAAELTGKVCKEAEGVEFGGKVPVQGFSSGESAILRTVRTVCKAFSRGGDEKSGVHGQFVRFVMPELKNHSQEFKSLPLASYKGNRFNILFTNAAHIFFLRDYMLQFLEANHGNQLLQSVLHDLNVPFFVGGLKALGLLSKFVTSPFWRVMEDPFIHIMDLHEHLSSLLSFIQSAVADIASFMCGSLPAFGNIKEDSVLSSLLSDHRFDAECQRVLVLLLPAIAKLLVTQFAEHLDGGMFAGAGEELRGVTRGAPKHNKIAEWGFGFADQLLRCKPNISVMATEAYLMFAANKTREWLSSKEKEEQRKLVERAQKLGRRLRTKFLRRNEEIRQKRLELVKKKIAKEEERKRARSRQREQEAAEIVHFGLWQTPAEVDRKLKDFGEAQGVEALKAQLRFREHVLEQPVSSKQLFRFSKDGKKLSSSDLGKNLKAILQEAAAHVVEPTDCEGGFLVGKKVKHLFEEDGEKTWYSGRITSQVPGAPHLFNIIYDDATEDGEEAEAVYSFRLLDDFEKGDLVIIQ